METDLAANYLRIAGNANGTRGDQMTIDAIGWLALGSVAVISGLAGAFFGFLVSSVLHWSDWSDTLDEIGGRE